MKKNSAKLLFKFIVCIASLSHVSLKIYKGTFSGLGDVIMLIGLIAQFQLFGLDIILH